MGLFRFTSFRMEIVKAFDSWLDSFTLAHPMSNKDPNVLLNWGTPWVPIGTVILYVFLVFTLPNLLGKKTLRLKWIVPLWNLGLSAFSFCVFWGVLLPYLQIYYDHGFYTGFCGDADIFFGKPSRMLYWIYVFDLSKFAELFDTLFLILRGKRVAFLHWFHHATVLLYCWFASFYHTGIGFNFTIVNAFVHTFMYFYYFLSEIGLKPPESVAFMITIIQISQMFLGIGIVAGSAYLWFDTGVPCLSDEPLIVLVAGCLMYGAYLFLFLQFFFKRYFGKKPEPAKKKQTPAKKKNQ